MKIKLLQVYCLNEKCVNYKRVVTVEWETNEDGTALKNIGWLCAYCLEHLVSPTIYGKI